MFHQSWFLWHIAPPLASSRESEKNSRCFPGTRQSAVRKQVQLCNSTSTQTQQLPNQTQSSGTRVSGKLINQGKGWASKNRQQRRRTTTYDHPALEGRRASEIGLVKLLNWLKAADGALFRWEYPTWFPSHWCRIHLSNISTVKGSLGKPGENRYWFPSPFSRWPPLPALISSHVFPCSWPPARVRHTLANRCSAASHGMSYGLLLDFCCRHVACETIEINFIISHYCNVSFLLSQADTLMALTLLIVSVTLWNAVAEASPVSVFPFQWPVCK